MRVAFCRIVLRTGFRALGDELMTLRTLEAAESCSSTSSRSRRSRTTSVSKLAAETLRRRTVGPSLRLGTSVVRWGDLACLPLPLERRVMASPWAAQNYTPAGLERLDYSRDLRPAKWDSGASLRDSNPEPLMSAQRRIERSHR